MIIMRRHAGPARRASSPPHVNASSTISPAITAVFVLGLLVPKAPQSAAVAGLLAGPVTYGILNWALPEIAFLNHMAFTFLAVVAVMTFFTLLRPRTEPVVYETASDIDLTPSRGARWGGVFVALTTVALYIVFW